MRTTANKMKNGFGPMPQTLNFNFEASIIILPFQFAFLVIKPVSKCPSSETRLVMDES